jgi:hypothetical protein
MVAVALTAVPTITMAYVSDCLLPVNSDALMLVNGRFSFSKQYMEPPTARLEAHDAMSIAAMSVKKHYDSRHTPKVFLEQTQTT